MMGFDRGWRKCRTLVAAMSIDAMAKLRAAIVIQSLEKIGLAWWTFQVDGEVVEIVGGRPLASGFDFQVFVAVSVYPDGGVMFTATNAGETVVACVFSVEDGTELYIRLSAEILESASRIGSFSESASYAQFSEPESDEDGQPWGIAKAIATAILLALGLMLFSAVLASLGCAHPEAKPDQKQAELDREAESLKLAIEQLERDRDAIEAGNQKIRELTETIKGQTDRIEKLRQEERAIYTEALARLNQTIEAESRQREPAGVSEVLQMQRKIAETIARSQPFSDVAKVEYPKHPDERAPAASPVDRPEPGAYAWVLMSGSATNGRPWELVLTTFVGPARYFDRTAESGFDFGLSTEFAVGENAEGETIVFVWNSHGWGEQVPNYQPRKPVAKMTLSAEMTEDGEAVLTPGLPIQK